MGDQPIEPQVGYTNSKNRALSFKGLVSAFSIAILFFVPLALWLIGVPVPGSPRTASSKPPPSIAQIQSMSDLATTRVHLSDYIEGENNHYSGRWSLHGEVILGVDLSAVRYANVDNEARRAILQIPQPHVISSKVDHERSEEVYLKAKVWMPMSDKRLLRDEVWKQADRKIEKLGHETGYMERAKVQTERALEQLFEGVGWKVDCEWQ